MRMINGARNAHLILRFIYFFSSLLVAFSKESLKCSENPTIPTYGQIKSMHNINYAKIMVNRSTPIEMTFNVQGFSKNMIDEIKWKVNGNSIKIKEDKEPPIYYVVEEALNENSFTVTINILTPNKHHIGKWEMLIEYNDNSEFIYECFVSSPPMVEDFDETLRAMETYEFNAVCLPASEPPPVTFQWYKVVKQSDNIYALKLVEENSNGHLNFSIVRRSNAGTYMCVGKTNDKNDSTVVEFKVKSNMAAIWPFLGILAELIVLLFTIIIYERHKATKRKRMAENDPLIAQSVNVKPSGDTNKSSSSAVNA